MIENIILACINLRSSNSFLKPKEGKLIKLTLPIKSQSQEKKRR